MKEKIKEALPKRILALILMVAMAVMLLPGMSMTVKAYSPMADHICSRTSNLHFLIKSKYDSGFGNMFKCMQYVYDSGSGEWIIDPAKPNEQDIADWSIFAGADAGAICYYEAGEYLLCEPEKYPIWVGDTQVTETNAADILDDNKASYDADSNTLILNGVGITENYYVAHWNTYGIYAEGNLNISLHGNNIIGVGEGSDLDSESYYNAAPQTGIYVNNGNLCFSGDGNLEIIDSSNGIVVYDSEDGNVAFGMSDKAFSGKVTIQDYGTELNTCAINVTGDIDINGGTYDLTSVISLGMQSQGDITINNATVKVNTDKGSAIYGKDVTIADSKVTVDTAGEDDMVGIGGASVIISGSKSDVTVTNSGEGKGMVGIGSPRGGAVSITDGKVRVKGFTYDIIAIGAEGESVYSEAALTIGSSAKPMTIKNAVRKNDSGASTGEVVTEGAGGLAVYDGENDFVGILGTEDDNEYLVIEPKGGTTVPVRNPSNNTPSTPGTTVPVSGEGTSNATVSVSGNNATVSISSGAINSVAGNTSQDKTDTITVDLSGLKETVTSTTISKEDASNIAKALNSTSNNKQFVEFKMAEYTVKADATAMSAVVNAATGSDLRLVVETTAPAAKLNSSQKAEIANKEVARTFEAYFVSNGTRIGNFNGGKVQVGVVKFNVPSERNSKNYHIEYLPESGKAERLKTRYVNGNLIFNTTHFSDYAIVYDEKAANDTGVLAYRLYDKNRGEHIYTIKKNERDMLVNASWIDETTADGKNTFYASPEKTDIYDTAVYRSYNPYKADPMKSAHMYTKDKREYDRNVRDGWEKDAGIVFYVAGSAAGGDNKVVYRAYNPNSPSGEHQWTVSKRELDALVKEGWSDETKGNAWYSPEF